MEGMFCQTYRHHDLVQVAATRNISTTGNYIEYNIAVNSVVHIISRDDVRTMDRPFCVFCSHAIYMYVCVHELHLLTVDFTRSPARLQG